MNRRNVSYLGLLPPPEDGVSDITDMYVAKYGAPPPCQKLFIVSRQQKNGWEGRDKETNEIVPGNPEAQQAAAEATLPLKPYMDKACTRNAQGNTQTVVPCCPEGNKAGEPVEEAVKSAAGWSEVAHRASGAPVCDANDRRDAQESKPKSAG